MTKKIFPSPTHSNSFSFSLFLLFFSLRQQCFSQELTMSSPQQIICDFASLHPTTLWDTTNSCSDACSFPGIFCDSSEIVPDISKITLIDLTGKGLTGTFPISFSGLSTLQQLILSEN